MPLFNIISKILFTLHLLIALSFFQSFVVNFVVAVLNLRLCNTNCTTTVVPRYLQDSTTSAQDCVKLDDRGRWAADFCQVVLVAR